MSAIDFLFQTAIDYERTHQLALYALLEKSDLPSLLVGLSKSKPVEWEPECQLFDLAVVNEQQKVYLELKMWSSLSDGQLKRQRKFLEEGGHAGRYILLGTSCFEFDDHRIQGETGGRAKKIGYDELIEALNNLLVTPGQSPDIYELALAYRNSLQRQWDRLKNAAFTETERNRLYYYSLFWTLQSRLPGLNTRIYTVNNPGGPVYVLNYQNWEPIAIKGMDIVPELYCEITNDKLCLKFFADTQDRDMKYRIRDKVREAARHILGQTYKLINAGRLGEYMTACQVEHDFGDVARLDDSARVFQNVCAALPQIARAIR